MVLLNMQTNENSTIIANFESLYNETYIKFKNGYDGNITFAAGILDNTFKIYNINPIYSDEGLIYKNNTLTVRNTNTQFISSGTDAIFPNSYTDINDYYIDGSSNGFDVINGPIACFDLSEDTYWQSSDIYFKNITNSFFSTISSPNDLIKYKFPNKTLFGDLIIIRLPYSVIPIGFSINSIGKTHDPSRLTILMSKIIYSIDEDFKNKIYDTTTVWVEKSFTTIQQGINSFNGEQNFYNTLIFIITAVNLSDLPVGTGYSHFIIKSLKIYTEPILTIDNNIKITNNNVFGIKDLTVDKLFIQGIQLGNIDALTQIAINTAIGELSLQFSFFWKVLDINGTKISYNDQSLVKKIALGYTIDQTVDAILDITGDICYDNKLIKKYISVINTSQTTGYSSDFILIGTLTNLETVTLSIPQYNTSYFNLKLYSYDIGLYYFQTINIYGYTYVNKTITDDIPLIYWNTTYDYKGNTFQRITDIKYIYSSIGKSITFYAVFNNNLNITKFSTERNENQYFNNIIYAEEIQTKYNNSLIFTFPSTTSSYVSSSQGSLVLLKNAKLISYTNLNTNINYTSNNDIKNLSCENIKFTKEINKNNVLITNSNSEIIETNISSNILAGLKIISYTTDSLVATDSNGVLKSLNIPNSLLNNLCNLVKTVNSNKIIATSANGLSLNAVTYNPSILSNLNNINTNINSIVVINSNGNLTTTNTLSYNVFKNFEETLNLFSFSNENQNAVKINSNLNLKTIYTSNIFIGNTSFTSNILTNRILVNNSEIGEDIFKNISKYPIQSDYSSNLTENSEYIAYYNNGNSIRISPHNNTTNNLSPLLTKTIGTSWVSSKTFNDNGNPTIPIIVSSSSSTITTGDYFILKLSENIILTNYSLYVNYSNIENTIKEFSVYGLNSITNTYDLLQTNSNVYLKNYFIPNNFFINKNNTNSYNTFLYSITKTNNISSPNKIFILGSIELFGYKINNDNNIAYNSFNNPVILGNSNVGIKNLNPNAPLSIGSDLYSNTRQSLINLNHDFFSNGIESPIINITKTSINTPSIGAIHYINNIDTSNTNYTIKLMHNYYNNEKTILSMNSDGKIGIGSNPIYSHSNNGLSIFNNGLSLYNNTSNYVNFQLNTSFSNSYDIVLPNSNGTINDAMFINNIESNKLFLTWKNPMSLFTQQSFIKIGNSTDTNSRNIDNSNLVLQITGSCLIGSNTNNITGNYLTNNTLIVAGNIYSTSDITTDSDIAYKYNIELIKNPLEKIYGLNGYIFNRNDTNDNEKYTGLIAQEVIKVMPEVIVKKHDGKLRVIYANLVGLLIEGIKKINNNYIYLNTKINFCFIFIFYLMFLNAKNGIFY